MFLRSKHSDDAEKIDTQKHDEVSQRKRIFDHTHLDGFVSIVTIKQERELQVTLWDTKCKKIIFLLVTISDWI